MYINKQVCFSAVRGDWNAHFAGFVTGLVLADTVV
jgi:membrane associated rhomboid family serine protease